MILFKDLKHKEKMASIFCFHCKMLQAERGNKYKVYVFLTIIALRMYVCSYLLYSDEY